MHDSPHVLAWRVRQDWALAQHYLTRALADLRGPLQYDSADQLAVYRWQVAHTALVTSTPQTETIADVRQRYGVDVTVQALHTLYTDRWTLEYRCRRVLEDALTHTVGADRGTRLMQIVEATIAMLHAEDAADDRAAEQAAWDAGIEAECRAYGPSVVLTVAGALLEAAQEQAS